MLKKRNQKLGENRKVKKIEKSHYVARGHIIKKFFACYQDKAKNEIKN